MTQARTTPRDYDELFANYFGFVKSIVHRAGIQHEDVEDVSMEILLRFFERDFLGKYDEAKEFETASGKRTAKFSSFLAGFVSKYVLQYRDKQMTRAVKEPVRCDAPVRADEEGSIWVEVFAPSVQLASDAEYWDAVQRAHEHLEKLPVRGKRDLARVFRSVVEQVTLDGTVSRRDIAREFGVSDTAVCHMFADLRDALRQIGFAPAAS